MRAVKTFLTVIGAITVLVLAANTVAYAATGGKFVLGKTNKAGAVSTLKRTTSGTALNVVTASSANAPMAVNGRGRVANLNADLLDGLDSTALRTTTSVFTKSVTVPVNSFDVTVPIGAGKWLMSYSFLPNGGGADGVAGGCYFTDQLNGSDQFYFGEDRSPTLTSDTVAFSGAGEITLAAGHTLLFTCEMPANFTTFSDEPVQVTATRTSILSSSALARAVPGGRAATR